MIAKESDRMEELNQKSERRSGRVQRKENRGSIRMGTLMMRANWEFIL